MQYCPNCGKKIPDNVDFCPYCGARISQKKMPSTLPPKRRLHKEESQSSSRPVRKAKKVNADITPVDTAEEPAKEAQKEPKERRSESSSFGKGLFFLISVILLVGGVAYLYMSYKEGTADVLKDTQVAPGNSSSKIKADNSLDEFMKDASKDCNRGDSSACLIIGLTCQDLSEGKCNSAAAEEYYKKACDLGDILACSSLGSLYIEGKRVERNYAKAEEYYKKACDLGSGSSCWSLGSLYEEGKGVERNYAKAEEYYKKACDLGNGTGCFFLGLLYESGESFMHNNTKAKEYYQKACDLGDVDACRLAKLIDAK